MSDAPVEDLPVDALTTAPSYGPCTTTAQCHSIQPSCLTSLTQGYPLGLCSRTCHTASECGPNGVCLPFGASHMCLPSCQTSTDCRDGYSCVLAASGTATPVNACLPFCTTDTQCPGVGCNVYSRFCGHVSTSLGDDGAPCGQGSDCKSGRCFTETDTNGNPTGNLGGLCFSGCTIAVDTAYVGMDIPQSDCPTGNVCPQDGRTPAGGSGLCREVCTTAGDCRPGYICVHPAVPGGDGGTYANGYCAAMNCHYRTQTCPMGTVCETTASSDAGVPTNGVCARGDGGVSTDAASPDGDLPVDGASDASAVTDVGREAGMDAGS